MKQVIRNGWPDRKEEVPAEIRNYFHFREELTIQDGILFKGNRVIVPGALRPYMVKKVHASHIGVEGCLRKARDVLFWPGMSAEIKDCVSKCDTCNTYQANQQKEPLIPHDPPKRPWSHVATDLFSFDNKDWFIVVDYWSDYFELNQLPDTHASAVIKALKNQFARHGIPDTLYSDNGPQFACKEFQGFASEWQFDHQTSSPRYPQSNGKIENAVKLAKRLLTKAKASGQDPYLAILDWRNTPSASIGTSPVQRLFGRRSKTLLPTAGTLLQPKIEERTEDKLKERKAKQEHYYNRGTRELTELQPGDTVRMKPLPTDRQKLWKKGVVVKQVAPRPYEVDLQGSVYRRNRRHLVKTKESPPQPEPELSQSIREFQSAVKEQNRLGSPVKEASSSLPSPTWKIPASPAIHTRYGRSIRPPQRLQDYVYM